MAVVPGYYLVCYNLTTKITYSVYAVVPGYYLVCYNSEKSGENPRPAVVPGYYLVCYNEIYRPDVIVFRCSSRLLLGML